MAKLTGAKKEAFLKRMAAGRRKASRGPAKKKTAKKNPRRSSAKKKKNGKLTGAKKAEFLKRMAAGRRKAKRTPAKKNAGLFSHRKTKKVRGQGTDAFTRHTKAKGRATKATRRKRRNDDMGDASAMFEKFHQKQPGRIVEYEEMRSYPDRFAELGKLMRLEFELDDANPDFPLYNFGHHCKAVCDPAGSNIYFVGGDQSIDLSELDIAGDKDMVELGPCNYIEYLTVKGFHDFEPTRYQHEFGEDSGVMPMLCYDRLNKGLFLVGGAYQVKREGIVD